MTSPADLHIIIENLAAERGVFRPEAYFFALEALDSAVRALQMPLEAAESMRHISGEDLLEWIRRLGAERFGPMAPEVFRSWGVHNTLDFGRIVFHLVDRDLLRTRDEDSLTDFLDKFDFEEAFSLKYLKGQA